MLLDRVLEAELCGHLIEYWWARDKVASIVGSDAGNVVDIDCKRRLDTNLEDPALFTGVRDAVVRRIAPAIAQASHIQTAVIEAPRVGCYDAVSGGWFRRHRDNTSRMTAHRQFAVSINLNPGDQYEGGELRFPEFGRQLYRPDVGCAVVFSAALLHEVRPVTRGRRFGLFTFLRRAERLRVTARGARRVRERSARPLRFLPDEHDRGSRVGDGHPIRTTPEGLPLPAGPQGAAHPGDGRRVASRSCALSAGSSWPMWRASCWR